MVNDNPKKKLGLIGIVMVFSVIVIAAVFVDQTQKKEPDISSNETQPVNDTGQNDSQEDNYASPNEDAGTIESTGQQVNTTVEIATLARPNRPVVGIGEPIKFENNNDFSIRLEFDRTENRPVIDPGSSVVMSFRSITYYQVFNNENNNKLTSGSISVE